MGRYRLLKLFNTLFKSNEDGISLMETMVALGILSLSITMIGAGVFQSLSVQRYWQDQQVATKDLRHVGSWFAGDALNAQSVSIGGTPAGSSIVIGWTDSAATAHTVTYNLTGTDLTRELDGATNTIAQQVVSVNWALTGKMVTMTLETQADRNTTEVSTLQTFLRVLS